MINFESFMNEGKYMSHEQYKTLMMAVQNQLSTVKDDYKQKRIDIKTLQYIAKRFAAIEQQITIEYKK